MCGDMTVRRLIITLVISLKLSKKYNTSCYLIEYCKIQYFEGKKNHSKIWNLIAPYIKLYEHKYIESTNLYNKSDLPIQS